MSYEYAPTPIDVAVLNVRDAFSDPARAESIVNLVASQRPEVMFFAEAFRSDTPGAIYDVQEDFDQMGYLTKAIPNQEVYPGRRSDEHGIIMIANKEYAERIVPVRLAGRLALVAEMFDPATDERFEVFGQHADDTNEQARVADAEALGGNFMYDEETGLLKPTIAMVVGGVVKRAGVIPRLLHAAGPAVAKLHAEEPDPDNPPVGLPRFASVAQRLADMATGDAYKVYESYGLKNADPRMEATMRRSGIPVKFAHIMHTPDFVATGHKVHPLLKAAKSNAPSLPLNNREISARLVLAE